MMRRVEGSGKVLDQVIKSGGRGGSPRLLRDVIEIASFFVVE